MWSDYYVAKLFRHLVGQKKQKENSVGRIGLGLVFRKMSVDKMLEPHQKQGFVDFYSKLFCFVFVCEN